jgi:hypothetical protein
MQCTKALLVYPEIALRSGMLHIVCGSELLLHLYYYANFKLKFVLAIEAPAWL